MRTRLGDSLNDFVAFHVSQLIEFHFEGLIARGGHRNAFHGVTYPNIGKAFPSRPMQAMWPDAVVKGIPLLTIRSGAFQTKAGQIM
ncbi:hypothetical protein GCM10008941_19670 [Rhizomicrobium palustre]